MAPPRMSMFPFTKDPKSDRMQRRIVSVIQHPHFVFALPSLSQASWDIILHDSHKRERLEFLGDALIGASISEELFRCWPNEGPGFYTKARSVLTANSTFAHIMQRLGFHNNNQPVKPTGDAFETILAAYHSERGPDAFNHYIRQSFSSLIQCVGHTYHDRLANELHARKLRIQRQQKQHQLSTDAILFGNVKTCRRLKRNNKLNSIKKPLQQPQQQPLRRTQRRPMQHEAPYRPIHEFEVFMSKTPVISGPSSSCKILATQHRMQHRVVVDLTSDEDNLIVESLPSCAPKPRNPIGKSKANLNYVPLTHSVVEIKPTEETESHKILRSVSVSPQNCGAAGTNSSLIASRRNNKTDQEDLVTLLSQASLNLPGSVTNPIMIGD